ncbi:lipoprotein [Escherichia coli]|uniref:Lipoprotein n=1 Tax=Escherichia coli TaxID=562 RepID=A0A376UCR2_ECOLX|nr:lipoprotein [Escherichia coli]
MRYSKLTMLIPCALLLVPAPQSLQLIKITAHAVVLALKEARITWPSNFMTYRILHRSNDINRLAPLSERQTGDTA